MKKTILNITFLIALGVCLLFVTACSKTTITEQGNSNKGGSSAIIAETSRPHPLETISANSPAPSISENAPKPTSVPIPENEFSELLPRLSIRVVDYKSTRYGITAKYTVIAESDFYLLAKSVQKCGFNITPNTDGLVFTAKNSDGYFIKIELTDKATLISVYSDDKHFR
ncbi:MAG: hypothetical protein GX802_04695 [Clostridiales bacterium]|jgi:hypothetical protein|nr:hypothetical protein [Clostridiales bacterium]